MKKIIILFLLLYSGVVFSFGFGDLTEGLEGLNEITKQINKITKSPESTEINKKSVDDQPITVTKEPESTEIDTKIVVDQPITVTKEQNTDPSLCDFAPPNSRNMCFNLPSLVSMSEEKGSALRKRIDRTKTIRMKIKAGKSWKDPTGLRSFSGFLRICTSVGSNNILWSDEEQVIKRFLVITTGAVGPFKHTGGVDPIGRRQIALICRYVLAGFGEEHFTKVDSKESIRQGTLPDIRTLESNNYRDYIERINLESKKDNPSVVLGPVDRVGVNILKWNIGLKERLDTRSFSLIIMKLYEHGCKDESSWKSEGPKLGRPLELEKVRFNTTLETYNKKRPISEDEKTKIISLSDVFVTLGAKYRESRLCSTALETIINWTKEKQSEFLKSYMNFPSNKCSEWGKCRLM